MAEKDKIAKEEAKSQKKETNEEVVDGKTAVGPGLKRVKATVEDVNRYQKEGVLYGWDGVSVAIIRVK